MNGKVYLKGVPYFSDSQVVELTQAEYDALPSTKLSDNVLYCIKDGDISGHAGIMPVIYSNDEREIGVWTDSKPLYQKTVHISALPSTPFVETLYPHGIANIDTICDFFGVVRWASTDGGVANFARMYIPASAPTTTDKYMWRKDCSWQLQCNKTNIVIATGSDRSGLNADVTIRYTKTTDAPGGGQWGTTGTPIDQYSTNEIAIGTWVDGKKLYRKCYKDINTGTAYVNKDLCNNLGIVICTKAYCISWASNVFKNIQMGYNHVTKKISFMESSDYITTIVIEYTKN